MTRARDISNVITDADLAGDIDVDGTTNLDVVDIDGALTQDGGAVFNEDSADVDFRVESNGEANMLVVDGGNNAVVIGESAPDTTVSGGTPAFQVIGSAFDSFMSLTRRVASASAPVLGLTKSRNTSVGSHTIVQNDDTIGEIVFFADDGTDFDSRVATIKAEVDGTPGANDTPGRLVFMTSADGSNSPTQRMKIESNGNVIFGASTFGADDSIGLATGGTIFSTKASSGGTTHLNIQNGGSQVGGITSNTGATFFNTSSDYRLKENVTYNFDATTKLKQLKPCRFNFIVNKDDTVDGFLAHEVSSIVPEAISGEKDATKDVPNVVLNADGTIKAQGISQQDWIQGKSDGTYANETTWVASKNIIDAQGIDQSKLVPLLVKTIQELEARITALENA